MLKMREFLLAFKWGSSSYVSNAKSIMASALMAWVQQLIIIYRQEKYFI